VSNRSGKYWLFFWALPIAGIVTFGVWQLLQGGDLGFSIGIGALKWSVAVACAAAAFCYLTDTRFAGVWPIVLAALWTGWWPALDYWSGRAAAEAMFLYGAAEPAWYSMWYTKWGVLVAIPGLGYGIPWVLRRRHK
jgi:hypothetical protein